MDRCTGAISSEQQELSHTTTSQHRRIAATLLSLILLASCLLTPSPAEAVEQSTADKILEQQREYYQAAKEALKTNNKNHYKHALSEMGNYPLKHYLQAEALFKRLNDFPRYDVRQYLSQYPDSPIAKRLRYRWLEALRKRDRWQDFLLDYQDSSATTQQQCYYQLARYRNGDKNEALKAGLTLWSVGKSQPKGCDKLFGLLIKQKQITEPIAWQRYTSALFNHEYRLVRYLKRFFTSPGYQELADRFYRIDRDHRLVGDYDFFSHNAHKIDSNEIHTILTHGLSHLAHVDAVTALKHWGRYRQIHSFNAKQTNRIITALVKGLYDQEHQASADIYLADNLEFVNTDLLEWRTRKALREANWEEASQWIEKMPEELQQDDRWQYWAYRTRQLSADKQLLNNSAQNDTYQMLSIDRSYYGFISSEWLGNGYSMAHRKTTAMQEQINQLEQQPGIIRTRELLHHKEYLYARREWRQATRNFSEQQWITAAHMVQQWPWYNGAITSMIQAGYWDDIDLRFPLAFRQHFETNARQTGVPIHLLFAVARQESALSHEVTSPAGAKGLMQLMPATAKQTARKNGIRYRNSNDLFNPETNIKLGSRYYREMLDRFDNNRILATAAYNAGPHRVERWLEDNENELPFDAWIETIPYRETRNYVQNVLAFSVIYAHHLGNHQRILSDKEKQQLL